MLNLDFIWHTYFSTSPKITEHVPKTNLYVRIVKQEKMTREKEMFLDKSENSFMTVVREWRWSRCKIQHRIEGEDWFPKPVAN